MKNLKIKIIKKIDSKFTKEWDTLVKHSKNASIFNTYQWHRSCMGAYGVKDDLIFTVYQGEDLVGILPLTKEKKFAVEVLTTPGKRHLEKSSILIKDNNPYILAYLLEAVLDYGNICLSEVSEEITQLLSIIKSNGLLTLSSINPYIELKHNPLGSLTKKQEKRILGKMKKNIKDLKFGHFRDNLDFHLKSIIELELRSSKKIVGKDSFSDEKIRKLFSELIKNAKGNVAISFVYYKNLPIVSSFGLVFGKTYLAFHTSFDDKYRSLIPGKMITYNMLLKLRNEGVSLFDLGRGHSVFKKEFTSKRLPQYDFYYSRNPLIRIWWKGINVARRIKISQFKKNNSLDNYYLFKTYSPQLDFEK